MKNEKLAQHLSNKLWISKDRIVEVLGEYVEEIQPTKRNLDIEQRDWTGVRFKIRDDHKMIYEIYFYTENYCSIIDIGKKYKSSLTTKEVIENFSIGYFIELPPITTTHNDFQIIL